MRTLLEEAITEYYGDRCPDFEPGCPCCRAWAEFDEIERLRARLEDTVAWCERHDYEPYWLEEARAALNGEEGRT